MRTRSSVTFFLLGSTALAQQAPQQQQAPQAALPASVLPGRPPEGGGELLGEGWESQAAGLAFRLPAGMKEIPAAGAGDDIVAQFVHEGRGWVLQVQRLKLEKPTPLTSEDAKAPGLLETTVKRLTATLTGAEVLRQDTTNTADALVGMVAVRYTSAGARKLSQQALVQAAGNLYYVLDLTTPAGKARAADDAPAAVAPAEEAGAGATADERLAVDTFAAVIDSVKLLGEQQAAVRAEQLERLFRSHAFFVNVNPDVMRRALVPERWFRVVRDGKDVGYTFITEAVGNQGNREGVAVSIETVTFPEPRARVVAHSELFVSFDRRHEEWTSTAAYRAPGADRPRVAEEIGISDRRTKVSAPPRQANPLAPQGLRGPDAAATRRAVTANDYFELTVNFSQGAPFRPEALPVYYVQQAFGHLLPRLLPREPQTYLFATYVPDRRQVMMRYVDVMPEREVALGGRSVTATPVRDRIGYAGPVTTHYVSPAGEYLGSVAEASKLAILPSDRRTVERIFQTLSPAEAMPTGNPVAPVTPGGPVNR